MKYICPLMTVSNIEISRNFYEKTLNQKVKFDFGENVTFEGDFSIHLDVHFKNLIDNKPIKKGSNSFELYFEHDEIEILVQKLKKETVEFVHELREQPWRQRVVRIYDPDKNIVEIGESMEYLCFRLSNEGISETEISQTTTMSLEFVKSSIQDFTSKS